MYLVNCPCIVFTNVYNTENVFDILYVYSLFHTKINVHDLRVLLANWPDNQEPTFFGLCLFSLIIKSTYLGNVPKVKSWVLEAFTVLWGGFKFWVQKGLFGALDITHFGAIRAKN